VNSREVVRALESDGWYRVAQKGSSHVQFKHPTKHGRITVPHPERDSSTGALRSIERQARVKLS